MNTLGKDMDIKNEAKLSQLGPKSTAKLLQYFGLTSLVGYSKAEKEKLKIQYNTAIDEANNKLKKKKFGEPKTDVKQFYPELAPLTEQKDDIRRWTLEQLGKSVEAEHIQQNITGAFTLVLASLIANVQATLQFNHISHFNNWFQKLLEHPNEIDSQGNTPQMREQNIFKDGGRIVSLTPIRGGCNSHPTCDQTKKSSFYIYEVTNVKSKNNNCLFKSLEHIYQQPFDIKQLRKHLQLPKGAILINDAYRVINHLNLDITIIDFKTADDVVVDGSIKYILYDDNHYTAVNSITEVLRKDRKTKRGNMTFDIETRATEEFTIVKATGQKLFIIRDTICSVYYKPYKQTEAIKLLFVTNEEKSSIRQLIDFLNDEAIQNRCYNIFAHNAGSFEYYFIVSSWTKKELLDSEVHMRGLSIIGLDYRGNHFKDTYCFLTASLEKLCQSFKIKDVKIDGCQYNGKFMTSMELCFYKANLKFNDFMKLEQTEPEFWVLYVKYCLYDSISLYQIWEQFEISVNLLVEGISPFLKQACPLNGSLTIGSFAKKLIVQLNKFKNQQTSYKNDLDKFLQTEQTDGSLSFDKEKYQYLCSFKRGGISHCHQAGKHMSGITGVDIASQYPASLVFSMIPTSNSFWLEEGAVFNKELYGFYHLSNLVFESDLLLRPIAVDILGQSLDWSSETVDNLYIDSYTIQYLIENFGLKRFLIKKALVSKKQILSEKIFGRFINNFYEAKKNQDSLKENGDPKYNEATRSAIKLILNALTGKLVEEPSVHFSLELSDNLDEGKLNFNGVGATKCSSGKWNDWIVAGIMVYSYSKRLLFEYIRCLPEKSKNVIHIETDGVYFSSRHLEQFKINLQNYQGEYPCRLGDDLGNLKIEKTTNEGQVAYFLGKKFYCITTNKAPIMRIKGVPQQSLDLTTGSIKQVVSLMSYETVYGGKEFEAEFSTLKKSLWGDKSTISSYPMSRTVRPNAIYKLYE